MAEPVFLPYLINSTEFTLKAGSWKLIYGSVDPQQLATAKVRIACDGAGGNVDVMLPSTSAQQSGNADLYFVLTNSGGGGLSLYPADGDLLNNSTDSLPIPSANVAILVQNVFGNNWSPCPLFVK